MEERAIASSWVVVGCCGCHVGFFYPSAHLASYRVHIRIRMLWTMEMYENLFIRFFCHKNLSCIHSSTKLLKKFSHGKYCQFRKYIYDIWLWVSCGELKSTIIIKYSVYMARACIRIKKIKTSICILVNGNSNKIKIKWLLEKIASGSTPSNLQLSRIWQLYFFVHHNIVYLSCLSPLNFFNRQWKLLNLCNLIILIVLLSKRRFAKTKNLSNNASM